MKSIFRALAVLLVLLGTGSAASAFFTAQQEAQPTLKLADLSYEEAVKGSPLIVRGWVSSGRDLAFRDGPQNFEMTVTETLKGQGQDHIRFSSWSSMYAVRFPKDKEVVIFLRHAAADEKEAPYMLMSRSLTDPLVLIVEEEILRPYFSAGADWGELTLADLRNSIAK